MPASQCKMPRFLFTPSDAPRDASFTLHLDETTIGDTVYAFASLRPDVSFNDHLGSSSKVLVASPNWPSIVEGIKRDGISDENIYVFLETSYYTWGLMALLRSLPGWPRMIRGITLEDCQEYLKPKKWLVKDGASDLAFDVLEITQTTAAANPGKVKSVIDLFSDYESRRQYQILLSGSPSSVFEMFLQNCLNSIQYFSAPVRIAPEQTILNGGLADAFELPFFLSRMEGRGRIISFDPGGFDAASPYVNPVIHHFADCLEVQRQVLWSSSGSVSLPVHPQHGILSQFKGRGEFPEMEFESVSVDDYVAATNPGPISAIKLDVEGAEPEVLYGARQTILRDRPQLMVSIYHWPEHMWELPLQIAAMTPGYDYYYRHHSVGRWEGVFYAIPPATRN